MKAEVDVLRNHTLAVRLRLRERQLLDRAAVKVGERVTIFGREAMLRAARQVLARREPAEP